MSKAPHLNPSTPIIKFSLRKVLLATLNKTPKNQFFK